MGFYNSNRYSKSLEPSVRQKISASKYKAPVDKFDDAWAVAVLNCTKNEADAVLRYAEFIQKQRARMRTPTTSPLPDGWTIEWSTENMRQEFLDADGKRYSDEGGILVEIKPSEPLCANGHRLDYPNQLCNDCGARMPLRAGEVLDDVFGDAELIKQREARQDVFDQQRREQQRIRSVDPTGRFSGLELD